MATDAPHLAVRRTAGQRLDLDWVRLGAWAGALAVTLAAWAAIAIAILTLTA